MKIGSGAVAGAVAGAGNAILSSLVFFSLSQVIEFVLSFGRSKEKTHDLCGVSIVDCHIDCVVGLWRGDAGLSPYLDGGLAAGQVRSHNVRAALYLE